MPLTVVLGYHAADQIVWFTTVRQMKKLLIIVTCIASLNLAACSSSGFHLVHKIDIQQGNVVTGDMLEQLETGMNRNQVQFVMGSPMVIDVFHQDRWDYVYYLKPGYQAPQESRVSLFFEDDLLARIETAMDMSAIPAAEEETNKLTTVVVPPQERVEPGLFNKIWHWITFRNPGEENP
jgi:outer membrane protein assembly factor BamE